MNATVTGVLKNISWAVALGEISDKLFQNTNFSTSRADDSCGTIFPEKNLNFFKI